jgi:hypothetical protein
VGLGEAFDRGATPQVCRVVVQRPEDAIGGGFCVEAWCEHHHPVTRDRDVPGVSLDGLRLRDERGNRRLVSVLSRACCSWWVVSSMFRGRRRGLGTNASSLWRGMRHHELPFNVATAASAAFCVNEHGSL